MKKPYCRPQLAVIALEAQDIVCNSIVNISIDTEVESQRSGELPPMQITR